MTCQSDNMISDTPLGEWLLGVGWRREVGEMRHLNAHYINIMQIISAPGQWFWVWFLIWRHRTLHILTSYQANFYNILIGMILNIYMYVLCVISCVSMCYLTSRCYVCRAHSGHMLRQWETALHCKVVSDRLSPYPKWSLCLMNVPPLNHWGRVMHICVGNLTI